MILEIAQIDIKPGQEANSRPASPRPPAVQARQGLPGVRCSARSRSRALPAVPDLGHGREPHQGLLRHADWQEWRKLVAIPSPGRRRSSTSARRSRASDRRPERISMHAIRWLLATMLLAALAAPLPAEQFPSKPITLVVPYAPAAMSTSARASCRPPSATRSASRSSSRTGPAPAAPSPANTWRARRRTATHCSSAPTGRSCSGR